MGRYLLTPFLDELSAYIDKMGFDRLIRLSYMYQPFVNVFLSFEIALKYILMKNTFEAMQIIKIKKKMRYL